MSLVACVLCAQGGKKTPRGTAGEFDYYLLALSWSPEHCAGPGGERDKMQCAGPKTFGFIVHGLWPQYEKGWPQYCEPGGTPDRATVDRVLDIMPSPGLVKHEWEKHGTCSGLSAGQYLDVVRKAYQSIRVPKEYQSPIQQVMVKPATLKRRFVEENRLPEGALTVQCNGRFLQEVRVCMDRSLKPRACGRNERDSCKVDEAIMRPVR